VTITNENNSRKFQNLFPFPDFRGASTFLFFQVFKEVWIGSDVVGLRRAIRKFGVERFKKNCILATEGFDWVMRKMYSGVTNPGNGSASAGAAVVNKKPEKRMSHVPAYSSKLEQ
jgi:hypothetical protein